MSSDQASTSSSQNTIILQSSDGETFEIKEQVDLLSQTIKHMIEDDCAGSCIPLSKVTGKILAKVIEYCTTHVESCDNEKVLKTFDSEFVKVDQETLFDIIMAANFLNIRSLLECMCQSVADMVKGKSTPEIRKIFNIRNDLTPEEEEEIREENAWAFN